MAESAQSFRDFEHTGWEDQTVCANYDAQLSRITRQSVQVLLDAAGVRPNTRVLDMATGAGYVAGAAAGGVPRRGALTSQLCKSLWPDNVIPPCGSSKATRTPCRFPPPASMPW